MLPGTVIRTKFQMAVRLMLRWRVVRLLNQTGARRKLLAAQVKSVKKMVGGWRW